MTIKTLDLEKTFGEAIAALDAPGPKSVVVTDGEGRLAGIVTDHDVRCALVRGTATTAAVADVMDPDPQTVQGGVDSLALDALFADAAVSAVVEMDAERRLLAVHDRSEREATHTLVDTAILMAGGEGKRLRPLTTGLPKPLLPIAGKPILERILERLRDAGIRRFVISLGYLAEKIIEHFGDGQRFGVTIDYVREERPLGTAGAIGLVKLETSRPLLVMNGDILTDLDIRAMAHFHRRERATVTMAARPYQHRIPYGVLRLIDRRIVAIDEKPTHQVWTNAGVYLLEPSIVRRIPPNAYLDMTVFIERLIAEGESVSACAVHEYWCDIGQIEDYDAANKLMAKRR